jgi:hypothetical protein
VKDEQAARRFEQGTDDADNRRLLKRLTDDRDRGRVQAMISRRRGGFLQFPSRDSGQRAGNGDDGPLALRPPPAMGHRRSVMIVTRREVIDKILQDDGRKYSSRVYAELGGGNFMLSLDPGASTEAGAAHLAQRRAFRACFPQSRDVIAELADLACEAASIVTLRPTEFDLVHFAEQAALRFCQKLMGYALTDHSLLEKALRAGYDGLVYQVLGRHFTTDPTVLPLAKAEMGKLLKRTSALIDAYADGDADADALKGTKDRALPQGFAPMLPKMAQHGGNLNGEQRAVIAVGAALGTVGNVQAAVCIAVKAFFADHGLYQRVRALARSPQELAPGCTKQFAAWQALIVGPLRDNPPIPFLPRVELDEHGQPERELLLALGGATHKHPAAGDDPLIWGLPGNANHWCAGQALAWPLIVEIVRHVMRLPGLAEQLDATDGSVLGLTKRWGFACEKYPLSYQRERRVAQSSLNVAMRLRSPARDNADRVRDIIRAGAPRIEEALRDSRHVHFAWFELIESDTVLVLHTVYDGPFAAYLQHFALRVGDLFDALFACIENPPPTPVDKFPNEFHAHLQRFDRGPVNGYFFSAYPDQEVAHILRQAVPHLP